MTVHQLSAIVFRARDARPHNGGVWKRALMQRAYDETRKEMMIATFDLAFGARKGRSKEGVH
jgi:hypothetical protein